MASAQIPRLYHSAAVLLPDGRVLSTGGNGVTQTEIYEPPYLFKGARPTITLGSGKCQLWANILCRNGRCHQHNAGNLDSLSSTTHAFNMNQRINRLSFSPVAGGLNVVAPSNANLAPPGLLYAVHPER